MERKGSAFVEGEDSESDEEINTEHMTASMEITSLRRPAAPRAAGHVPGVVAGEGSETDEEDSRKVASVASSEQPDGATLWVPSGVPNRTSGGSTPRSSRRSSGDSSSGFPPPS